jgi:maleylacetate reductase
MTISGEYTFRFQDKVVYGRAFVAAAAQEVDRLEAQQVFVMSSRSLADTSAMKDLVSALGARHAGTYTGIRPNSLREDVLEGVGLAKAANADLLIAFGGGSVVDSVKVMQICLWNDLATIADLDAFRTPTGATAKPQITDPTQCKPRILAVPTLLSGAEFTHFAGVTDQTTGRKEAYEHPLMIPQVVILDPALLAASPVSLIATTGVRAIDHCVESFCSPGSMPFFNALAIEGLRQLWTHLPQIVAGAATPDAFTGVQLGAWMAISSPAAGVAVGASHAIGRVIGSLYGVEHGHGSSLMLPAVMRWNAQDPVCAARQAELMDRAGIAGDDLSSALIELFTLLRQPTRLREVGVGPDKFDKTAEFAMEMLKHPSVVGNPRPITMPDHVIEILNIAR